MTAHNRVLLISAWFLAGCSDAAPNRDVAASTATDSSGVTIVQNVRPQWSNGSGWLVDTVPSVIIGADSTVVESQFRFVRGVVRLRNGNIVIAADEDVRMFSADGKFVRTVSRRGNGPGEFQSIGSLLRLANDTLLVSQAMAEGGRKIALFSADGKFIREERPDADKFRALGPWNECESRVFPNRAWLGCKHDSTIPVTATNRPSKKLDNGFTSPGPGLYRRLDRWHLIAPNAEASSAIGVYGGIEQFGVDGTGSSTMFFSHPFYSRSLIASGGSPLRIATITNPQYAIEIWTPTGQLARVIRRTDGRRTPTTDEAAGAVEAMRERYQNRSVDQITFDAMLAKVPSPDSLPAASALVIGESGHIAVGREGMIRARKSSLYDIFTAEGQWLGEIQLPRRTYVFEFSEKHLLAVRYTDDDVPVIVLYPVRSGTTKAVATSGGQPR